MLAHRLNDLLVIKGNSCLISWIVDLLVAPCYLAGAILQTIWEGVAKRKLDNGLAGEGIACCQAHTSAAEIDGFYDGGTVCANLFGLGVLYQSYL